MALRCRTSDRTPLAGRGVETLARLIGGRLGTEARQIGSPSEAYAASFEDDLRESRGCLLEAGGQVDDALEAGKVPVLVAGECSIGRHHAARRPRHRPDARVLWLDAHADYNTPATTSSAYLGGMSLSAPAASGTPASAARSRPRGWCWPACATSTPASGRCSDAGAATVVGASVVETLVAVKNALDGAPVYVHVDLDVIDPEHFPAQFPAPGGLHPEKLYDLAEAVSDDSEIVGLEVTAFEAPEDPVEHAAAAEIAMRVLDPFLDRLVRDRQSKE